LRLSDLPDPALSKQHLSDPPGLSHQPDRLRLSDLPDPALSKQHPSDPPGLSHQPTPSLRLDPARILIATAPQVER
jgi:hypothetical protein